MQEKHARKKIRVTRELQIIAFAQFARYRLLHFECNELANTVARKPGKKKVRITMQY